MIDEQTIRRWWQVFKDGQELVEVRILGTFAYSGYYRNIEKLISDIRPYEDMADEQIYFTLNTLNDGCYGRQQCEKIVKKPKSTSSDSDVTRRKFVMIDFDPVRTVGVNASDEEFEFARLKAQQVYLYLQSQGFSEPIICKSGNGWHCHYRVDLPNTPDVEETLKRFLQSVAVLFTDEHVDIDQKVFNASRICKLYGTTAKKGANIPERPWRASTIDYVPNEIRINDISLFQKIADMLPKEEPRQQGGYRGYGEKFDVESFLREHGVGFKKKAIAGGTKYVLDECIFDSNHKSPDAAVFQRDSGEIGYICFHSHCASYTWRDVRLKLDPHAYDPKPQQFQQRQYTLPQAIQPTILPETADKGKKWLGMKDIKRVNINDIPHFLTGFKELDAAIKGLFFCEVTILSGSNSSGKSSWLNTLILNAIQQGVKVALWSGELRKDVLKTWIQMVAAGKDYLKQSQQGYWYVPSHTAEKIDNWLDGKFFLYNNEYSNKWAQIFNDMKELLAMGVRLFVLDNLMSMDIDLFEGDSNKKQKGLIQQIVDFAKKEQVHLILVAHPRKVSTFIRKTDISGTSDLTNAVDDVFIVHRVNTDFKKLGGEFLGKTYIQKYFGYGNVVEVAKCRMMGAQDVLCGMYYEVESRRFKNEQDELIVYGWRDDVGQQQNMFENNTNMPFPTNGDDALPF